MKRILILPVKTEGIIDLRKHESYILDDVQYLEQIQNFLLKESKNMRDYKFCQFEEKEVVHVALKIKDKLSNGFQEFETEYVSFRNAPIPEEEKQSAIRERHLKPIQSKINNLVTETVYMMASERLGDTIDEDQLANIKIEKEKLDKQIKEFDYQAYLDEVV